MGKTLFTHKETSGHSLVELEHQQKKPRHPHRQQTQYHPHPFGGEKNIKKNQVKKKPQDHEQNPP
ncbi:hypothetical protein ACVGWR_00305, partial [Enterobacter hormaechei]